MTDSNLVRFSLVPEATYGVQPASPVFQIMRVESVSLAASNTTVLSDQIDASRMASDQILVGQSLAGGFNFEFSDTHFDALLASSILSSWVKVLEKSGSTQCGAVTITTTFAVDAGGATAVVGHLIGTAGYTSAANNGTFRVASSTATTIVISGATLVNEASVATSFLKIIGFRGVSGDLVATSTGMTSTTLDFTTLGLAIGMTLNIGGIAGAPAGESFATAACNDFVRITAIAAHALTFDNLPTGWAADAGTSKTISVYMPDYVRVGSTVTSYTGETVHLDQASPTYVYDNGLMVNKLTLSCKAQDKFTGTFDFLGLGSGTSGTPTTTAASGATYTASPTTGIFNTTSNVARVTEAGNAIGTPNFVTDMQISVTNNLRELKAVASLGAVGIGKGRCEVTGTLTTYFGSLAIYTKARSLTNTALINFVQNGTKAYAFIFPRVQLSAPRPNAGGINQDVTCVASFNSAKDTTTNTNFQIDKYYQA